MIRRAAFAICAMGLFTVEGCFSMPGHAQASYVARAKREAARVGLAERVGEWKLARYISGEHAHFLFVHRKQAFSLFLSAMKPGSGLKLQPGWEAVPIERGTVGFLHKDAREPGRNAFVWSQDAKRWMVLGNLTSEELVSLAKQFRKSSNP